MSAAFSAASEDSTRDSDEPDTTTSSSAKPTRTGETCSENDSPESPSMRTYAPLTHPALTKNVGKGVGHSGMDESVLALISSAEGSPAKTSALPDDAQDSQETGVGYSSSSPESLSLFDPAGFSSRTYPVSSLATAVGTSESCLERWPTSGTAWLGGFSTHVSSECRSADGVCSSSEPSLTEILEPPQSVPARYSLSARAARGILHRAEKRGRTLPAHLEEALATVAGMTETRSIGGGHSSLSGMGSGGPDDNDAQAGRLVVAGTLKSQRGKGGGGIGPEETLVASTLKAQKGRGWAHDAEATYVAAPLTKGSATGEGVNQPGRRQEDDVNIVAFHPTGGVRRLTPTECERLQGFPDGWTQLGDTADSKRYSALGDAVTVNVAEWIGGRLAA